MSKIEKTRNKKTFKKDVGERISKKIPQSFSKKNKEEILKIFKKLYLSKKDSELKNLEIALDEQIRSAKEHFNFF